MLEGVTIITHIIIIIVGVGEEGVACRKDITGREVGHGQEGLLRLFDDEKALVVVGQVLAQLVAQVRVGVTVSHDLHGLGTADAAVVGGDDDLVVRLCQLLEEV